MSFSILKNQVCKKYSKEIKKVILKFCNKDGGFGARNHSDKANTYFAIESLNLIGEPLDKMNKTTDYVLHLQNNDYGFSSNVTLILLKIFIMDLEFWNYLIKNKNGYTEKKILNFYGNIKIKMVVLEGRK
ncbi:MAG: hypothetical protein QXZ43_01530 [Candidatus Aenigmatarchaeota archaeon]